MSSNEKKSATLGVSHGAATSRLRKLVLFSVLKRHNENACFRCLKVIETADELSIEHKKAVGRGFGRAVLGFRKRDV
jgi:hypothetical protein